MEEALEQVQVKERILQDFLLAPITQICEICASKAEVDRPALKPNESCDQLQQWYATARSLPHSQCCWKGSGLPYRPEGNGFCPSNEWTPRSAPPAPRTQSHSSHEFSPMWKLSSKYADTCHLERLTKNKTAVNNPENYANHGTSKALTNVSFRDHVTSRQHWLA